MPKENTTDKMVRDYLLTNNISYEVKFRPTPQPGVKQGYKFQLNWFVFIGGQCFEYSTGVGWLPPSIKKLVDTKYQTEFGRLREACETGSVFGLAGRTVWSSRPDYQPKAASFLSCLLFDATADTEDFEDWATNLGYSTDSIAALAVYEACVVEAKKLRKIFNRQQMTELETMLQDY